MEQSANKTLVSLLRNSVLLEITTDRLVIGYTNTKLFTDKKKEEVADAAKAFFNKTIEVSYKENTDGIDDTVSQKQKKERLRQITAEKKEAERSKMVQAIMREFPGSEICSIEIIEENEDV
ncbi:hypothetical protein KJ966_10995 [bacterium]|nr:hypothetical protein [bacterium]